jgi:hypothetical protein
MELKPAVYIHGAGVVTPAGWGMGAFRTAVAQGTPLPVQGMNRPGWNKPLNVRPVPAPANKPTLFAHARFRRVSPLSQYCGAAAVEALEGLPLALKSGRIGLVFCLQSGPVQYACRFYQETLKDPATASPLVFPETVFAAPASHLAALLGNVPLATTLVGDAGTFLQGVALAADLLTSGDVDAALVVGGEEFNWMHAEAAWLFDHGMVISGGAGALCLAAEPEGAMVSLERVTNAFTYTARRSQRNAADAVRRELPAGAASELLCDSTGTTARATAAEENAWTGWPGTRLSPKRVFGDGIMAAAGWQCAAAFDAIANNGCPAANVSIVGCNQQAIGARFTRA